MLKDNFTQPQQRIREGVVNESILDRRDANAIPFMGPRPAERLLEATGEDPPPGGSR